MYLWGTLRNCVRLMTHEMIRYTLNLILVLLAFCLVRQLVVHLNRKGTYHSLGDLGSSDDICHAANTESGLLRFVHDLYIKRISVDGSLTAGHLR